MCSSRTGVWVEGEEEASPSNARVLVARAFLDMLGHLACASLDLLDLAADGLLGARSKHLVEHVVGAAVGHKACHARQAQAASDQQCHSQCGQQEQGAERSKAALRKQYTGYIVC